MCEVGLPWRVRSRRGRGDATAPSDASAATLPRLVTRFVPQVRGPGLRVELVGQSAQTTVLNFFALVSGFVSSVVLSRILGARGYGAYVYAISWPTLLAVAAQRGYSQLLVREIAARSVHGEWGLVRGVIRQSWRVVLSSSVVLMAATAFVGWRYVAHGQPILRQAFFLALLLVPALAIIPQREAILRGFGHVALGRLPETVVQPAVLLGAVAMIRLLDPRPMDARDAVAATVIAAGSAALWGSIAVRRRTPPHVAEAPLARDTKRWSQSARSLLAFAGLAVANMQMGVLVVGALEDVDDAAVFSAALRWSVLVAFLQTAALYPLAPALARLLAAGERSRLQTVVTKASRGVLVASIPVVLGLWVLGEHALAVFGEDFRDGAGILRILVIGELVNVASGFGGPLLINANDEHRLFVVAAWLTGLKTGIVVGLTELFGIQGAAFGHAFGVALQNLVFAAVVWQRLRIYTLAVALPRLPRRSGSRP